MDLDNADSKSGLPECAETTVTLDVVLPSNFERYVPQRFHARGGMGEVWLAVDSVIGREVALKYVRHKLGDQHDRFVAEAQITGQLEHPAIVPVHDIGKAKDGQPYYVMKFVRGRSLKTAIDEYHSDMKVNSSERIVQFRRLLEVFIDLCEAVAYAHSRGVIHRDLKPDNVMLGTYGETVVLDWGLAKLLHQQEIAGPAVYAGLTSSARSDVTHDGSVIGSPPYMPPEMAEGRASDAGPQTDVYLLGATLYCILCGETPRRGSSHKEMVELARTLPPLPPRQRNSKVPRALNAICVKAMAMLPQNRYETATAVADDMRRYLADESVHAYPEGLVDRTTRFAKRHSRRLAAIVAVTAILILVVLATTKFKEATRLHAREKARDLLLAFREQSDAAHYYLANTNPASESAPYYDMDAGKQSVEVALGTVREWGRQLENLPLENERPKVKSEVYELILLLVQARENEIHDELEARELLGLLDRARDVGPNSQAMNRLQSRLLARLGKLDEARQADDLAKDPNTPASALDVFLMGESHRIRSGSSKTDPTQPQTIEQRRELGQAVAEYEAALQQDSNDFWSHYQLGRCYLALGQPADSLAYLRACVALRPESSWARSTYGLVLAITNQNSNAIQLLGRVINEHPDFLPARLNRGFAFWRQNLLDEALRDFDAVLQNDGRHELIEAAFYRAQIQLQRGNLKQSLEDADRLVSRRPNFGPAYLLRAKVHFLSGQDREAITDLEKLVSFNLGKEFDRSSAISRWQLGRLLRVLGTDFKSSKDSKRALQLALSNLESAAAELNTADVHHQLGLVQQRLGKLKEATESYSKGLEKDSNNLTLRNLRATAFDRQSLHDKAAADFRLVAQHRPTNSDERILVAEAHARLGYLYAQKDPAVAESEAVLALLTLQGAKESERIDHYMLQHNVGCIYGELANTDEAHRGQLQKTALSFIEAALELAERRNARDREVKFIEVEPAFSKLHELPEYKKLIGTASPPDK